MVVKGVYKVKIFRLLSLFVRNKNWYYSAYAGNVHPGNGPYPQEGS
jgi:hypothetical protein